MKLKKIRWKYAVFRKTLLGNKSPKRVGKDNEFLRMLPRGNNRIMWKTSKKETQIKLNKKIIRNWKFGCQYAGRGSLINRVCRIKEGEIKIIHEVPKHISYVKEISTSLEGDQEAFPAYKREIRLRDRSKPMEKKELQNMIDLIVSSCEAPTLVTGGHYMPYLFDLDLTRGAPVSALTLATEVISAFREQRKKADLAIVVNDLHMGKGTNKGNEIRETFWKNHILPSEYSKVIDSSIQKLGEPYEVMVVGERILYNRFARMRKADNPNKEAIANTPELQKDTMDTKCIGALTYFVKLVSSLGYKNIVQIYPACDHNSVKAAKLAHKVYGDISTVYTIFTTVGC